MEKRSEVKTVKVELVCGSCNEGTMERDGVVLMSNPPHYPHRCTECGAEIHVTNIIYPYMEYK